jgi:hypothetical protein
MYELKLDKKILRKSRLQCMLLGCLSFFFVAFVGHLLLYPLNSYSVEEVLRPKQNPRMSQSRIVRSPPNRMTVSILMATLGLLVGAGFSRGHALNVQRRRDLKKLIEEGKQL